MASKKTATVVKEWLPQPISPVMLAFPANVLDLMPDYADLPEEFRSFRSGKWMKFAEDWFGLGLKDLQVTTREGIDKDAAMRHLAAIIGSFQPKHEHKIGGIAYLASLWFDDVKYERGSR